VAGVTVGAFFLIVIIAAVCSHKWWRVYFTRKMVKSANAVSMWRSKMRNSKIKPGTKEELFGGSLNFREVAADKEKMAPLLRKSDSIQPDHQPDALSEYGAAPSSFGNGKPPSFQTKLPGQTSQLGNTTFGGAAPLQMRGGGNGPLANSTKIVPKERASIVQTPTISEVPSGIDEMDNFPPPPPGADSHSQGHDDAGSFGSSEPESSA
jgi:hypothetical protein